MHHFCIIHWCEFVDCVAALKDRLDRLEADMKKELVKVFLSCLTVLLSVIPVLPYTLFYW